MVLKAIIVFHAPQSKPGSNILATLFAQIIIITWERISHPAIQLAKNVSAQVLLNAPNAQMDLAGQTSSAINHAPLVFSFKEKIALGAMNFAK